MRVLVLGAGVIGTTSAWYLRQAGYDVTVVDRQPAPALETSFANAGQLSFGYTSPWAAPGVPFKAIAELIGQRLGVPVVTMSKDEALAHFGWFGMFVGMDLPTSSARTREVLDWTPSGPDLLTDIGQAGYFAHP